MLELNLFRGSQYHLEWKGRNSIYTNKINGIYAVPSDEMKRGKIAKNRILSLRVCQFRHAGTWADEYISTAAEVHQFQRGMILPWAATVLLISA
jgi:hypothetical protein